MDRKRRAGCGVDGPEDGPDVIHQGGASTEKNVGDTLLFGDLPHSFLIVEIGGVLGEPEDLDMLANFGMVEKRSALLGGVNRSIVRKRTAPNAYELSTPDCYIMDCG